MHLEAISKVCELRINARLVLLASSSVLVARPSALHLQRLVIGRQVAWILGGELQAAFYAYVVERDLGVQARNPHRCY